jgi:8-oxo-dGTP diphosphatase
MSSPDGSHLTNNLLWFGAGLSLSYLLSHILTTMSSISTTIFPPTEISTPNIPPKTRFVVGVGVIVRDGDKILIGKRLNSLGEGTFAVPGGRIDPGETYFMTGLRELYEETGIKVYDIPFDNGAYIQPQTSQVAFEQYQTAVKTLSGPIFEDQSQSSNYTIMNQHNAFLATPSVEVYCPDDHCQLIVRMVIVDRPRDQEPKLTEEDKCEGWYWVKWSDIKLLAHYHNQISQSQHYQKLSLELKASLHTLPDPKSTQFDDKIQSMRPYDNNLMFWDQSTLKYVYHQHKQDQYSNHTGLFPLSPEFSPNCPLSTSDKLFGPLQAFALSSFDPMTAKSQ